MKMHRYPSYMVPYVGLNPDVDVDALLQYGDFAVARRIDQPFSEEDIAIFPDKSAVVKADSSLREDVFNRIPRLSMTMLRLEFPLTCVKYDIDMKGEVDDWKGRMVRPWKYRGKATSASDGYLLVYNAENLHNKPADYQRKFESLEEAENVQENYEGLKDGIVAKTFSRKKYYKAIGCISLRHAPTMLNYWHFELRLRNGEGEEIKSVKYKPNEAPSQMNIRSSFVNYVLDNYLFKMLWIDKNPCEKDIPISCFYSSSTSSFNRRIANRINKCVFALIPIVK